MKDSNILGLEVLALILSTYYSVRLLFPALTLLCFDLDLLQPSTDLQYYLQIIGISNTARTKPR